MFLFFNSLLITAAHVAPKDNFYVARAEPTPISAAVVEPLTVTRPTEPREVPFYSQFADIDSPEWKKVGCGVTSLAMVIDYYSDETVSVNALLARGLAAGAYLPDAGWTYAGLIGLGERYDLTGSSHDLAGSSASAALAELRGFLEEGPVIASVHYKFEPTNPIPHLVVLSGVDGDTIYYNDPAAKSGSGEISVDGFVAAWKKRFVVIRPTESAKANA